MKKQKYFLFKIGKWGPLALLLAAVALFASQTNQAVQVVNFHAELMEKKQTVIIDAGHGGEDGGSSSSSGILEKDINLAIALDLRDLLVQDNYDVIMIREGDYAVGDTTLGTIRERKRSDMNNRIQTINESGESILVSIHQNHFTESQYHGAQMFYSANREESAQLAESIRFNIIAALQPENNRESKPADSSIYLLDSCKVPGVIVECGFLSNPEEAEKLNTESYQKQMAYAIYSGVTDYFKTLDAGGSGEVSGINSAEIK